LVFPYVRFMWDIDAHIVCRSTEKCTKFVLHLSTWVKGALVSKEDCNIILGTLCFVSFILFF
jgi:hypothetical protein